MSTVNAAAAITGSSGFFSDPTKVTLIPYFKSGGGVPSAFKATISAPSPQPLGGLPSSSTVGVIPKPPNSKQLGVPNEG